MVKMFQKRKIILAAVTVIVLSVIQQGHFGTDSVRIPNCPFLFSRYKLLFCGTRSEHSRLLMRTHIVEKVNIYNHLLTL